jgi:hypothetical protein
VKPKKAASPEPEVSAKGAKRCLVGSLIFILAAGQQWAVEKAVTVTSKSDGWITADVYRNTTEGSDFLPLGGPVSMALYFGMAIWMFLFLRDRTFKAPPRWLVWGGVALTGVAMYKLFGAAALAGLGNQTSGLSITFAAFIGAVGALMLLLGALAYRGVAAVAVKAV